jgi:hypothetical protein
LPKRSQKVKRNTKSVIKQRKTIKKMVENIQKAPQKVTTNAKLAILPTFSNNQKKQNGCKNN